MIIYPIKANLVLTDHKTLKSP